MFFSKKEKIEKELPFNLKFFKEAKSIGVIVFIVFSLRSSVLEPFRIPSGSMIPTLMIGDFILVNKMSYGIKLPFSEIFDKPIYLWKFDGPQKGDVIVFKYPNNPDINYIKRLIGQPGDKIEVQNKFVYVNDKKIPNEEIDGTEIMADMDEKFQYYNFKFYKSKFGDHEFVNQINVDNYNGTNFNSIIVPDQHYFGMGDNRDHSSDSRFWGPIPEQNIKGKAILVWFSMIFPFGQDAFKFRAHRIGKLID